MTKDTGKKKKKLTKKEFSKVKEAARKKRRKSALTRLPGNQEEERENPISVEVTSTGEYIFHGRSLSPTADKNKALEPYGKELLQRGVQFQVFPTEEQKSMIRRINGCVRVVRNDYLNRRIALYNEERIPLSVTEYKSIYLPQLKEEKPWLKEADKFALEAGIEFVDKAYKAFFNGIGDFPKYVSKYKPNGQKYTTKYTNNNISIFLNEKGVPYVKLPKVGAVRIVVPKGKIYSDLVPTGGRITKATVAIDNGNFLVSIAWELVSDIKEALKSFTRDRIIAMDMGIRKFCDYGHGDGKHIHVENPKWLLKHEKRLRRFQKALSRKKYDETKHKGSNNWVKAKKRVAKEMRKVANQRKDFQHKLSFRIANSCDVFICENLNIKGMLRNRHLAKHISSAGWGQFLNFVKYKIEARGGIFHKIDRWFPSSKTCPHCKHVNKDLKDQLIWICPSCFTRVERDDGAVENIAEKGIADLSTKGIVFTAA